MLRVMGAGQGKSRRAKTVSQGSLDSVRALVGDDASDPLIADLLGGPAEISFSELRGVTVEAGDLEELHSCLEVAYDAIPDRELGELAEQFEATLALTAEALRLPVVAKDELELSGAMVSEIRGLLSIALDGGALDDEQEHRLDAALELLS
jgi:hypothetical protein